MLAAAAERRTCHVHVHAHFPGMRMFTCAHQTPTYTDIREYTICNARWGDEKGTRERRRRQRRVLKCASPVFASAHFRVALCAVKPKPQHTNAHKHCRAQPPTISQTTHTVHSATAEQSSGCAGDRTHSQENNTHKV